MRVTTLLGGLDCRVIQDAEGAPSAVAIICHGFGAPGDDLVGLHPELVLLAPALRSVRFIFPSAPLSLAAMGYGEARAWWLIDFELIQALNSGDPGRLQEFRQTEPEGMSKARAMLLKLVDEVLAATGLPVSKLALGGFSQGAMLATDVALRLPEPPAALAILSGTLLVEDVWRAKATARAGLAVLQSHGTVDPVLRFADAERLRDLLTEAGARVQWVPFDGPHTISLLVLRKLAAFLAEHLGP